MADVTKIPGSRPTEPPRGPREPAKPGTEKFKELMKVDKSDEEQKKKKKRQEQAQEDAKARLVAEAAAADQTPLKSAPTSFPKSQKSVEIEKKIEETAQIEKAASPPEPPPLEPLISETPPPPELPIVKEKPSLPLPLKKEKTPEETIAPVSSSLGPLLLPPAPESAPAYTLLKPEVLSLFERMVSQIVIMQNSGVNETTIHLNTPDFYNSIFAGARIVIKEWSTAPLAYNIEFFGTQQNTGYFQQNIPGLWAAFNSEKRSYKIQDIKASFEREDDRPLFHRKDRPSGQNQEQP